MDKEMVAEILKRSKAPLFAAGSSSPLAAALASETGLSAADLLTIRDLAGLSGYHDDCLQALLVCMFLSINEGSICLKLEKSAVAEKLSAFLDRAGSASMASRITGTDLLKKYPAIISSSEDDYKPLVLKELSGGKFLYFQKFPRYESELKEELASHINYKDADPAPREDIKKALREVLYKEPVMTGATPVKLDREQYMAVCLSLLKNFVIISGGPGTGKTSIVVTILRCLTRLGILPEEMCVTAPTGRAAQRMADSVQRSLASVPGKLRKLDEDLKLIRQGTIHRLLGYNPYRDDFKYNADNHLPVKAVIIDEVSMIDIVLMARLFEALEPGTKVVLLGDKDQLPSVDAGAVLADLMPEEEDATYSSGLKDALSKIDPAFRADFPYIRKKDPAASKDTALTDRVVMLKRSYRSGKGILDTASAVNAQDLKTAERLPAMPLRDKISGARRAPVADWPAVERVKPGCFFLDADPADIRMWHDTLDSWISMRYFSKPDAGSGMKYTYRELIAKSASLDLAGPGLKDRGGILGSLFKYMESGKILTLVKRGLFGTFAVNRYITRRLYPEFDRGMRGKYFAGSPIMITENDPVRGLYNGDVGIVLKTVRGSYHAVFQRMAGFISFSLPELALSEAAFAITVHKSQGSEYDNVLLALPPDGKNRLLTKEIIYTALTRARQSVVVYGSRDILRAAIGRRIERQSGLRLWK